MLNLIAGAVGVLLLVAGVALLSIPAALVVAGLALLAAAILLDFQPGERGSE